MNLISPETRFDELHFCCRLSIAYACLHCDRRAELPKLTEVSRKIPSKTRYVSSRSFEVIEFGTSRTGIYDFLLR